MLKKTETKLWLTATNATQSNDLTARRESMSSRSWHRLSGRPPLPTGNLKLALRKTLVWYLRIKWSIHEHVTKKKLRCISFDLSMFHWTDQVVFVLTSVATSLKSTTCFSLSNHSVREKGTQITPHCQDLEYSQTLERFLTLDILAVKNRLKSYLEEMMRKKAFVFAKT